MKKLIEKGRRYRYWDFVKIPMSVAPAETVLRLINVVTMALMPVLQTLTIAEFVDTALLIFGGDTSKSIWKPLILLVLITAYTVLAGHLSQFMNLRIEIKLNREYRVQMVEKRARLAYTHVENNETWDLVSRVCEDPAQQIRNGMNNIVSATDILVRVFSLLIVLVGQVWWAGLAIVGISLPLFALAIKAGKSNYQADVEAKKYNRRAKYLRGVLQGRDNVEERAMFGYTGAVNQKWRESYEKWRTIHLKTEALYFVKMKGASLITVLLSLLIISILLLPLSQGLITVGMFMGLVTNTLNLIQMMSWQLAWTMSELAKNREYLKDLSTFGDLDETEGALELPSEERIPFETIDFINVSFAYPGTETYILKNLNLHLEKGRHYAFVGVNGAGKTTLTKLLTGLYDNYEGEILINGVSLRKYSQAQLKSLFSVVYQDFAKYSVSVRENVQLGDVLVQNDDRVREILEQIGLDMDLDINLGKIRAHGTDLSGGQWQRVAIARSLYSRAAIRILDEPTAALDPVAESEVYEMFGRISAGQSTIFITHRLGAARLADQIIVLDDGHVAEQGSHEELIGLGGIYSQMFEAQRSWYQ